MQADPPSGSRSTTFAPSLEVRDAPRFTCKRLEVRGAQVRVALGLRIFTIMTTMPPPAGKSAAPPSNNEAAQAKLRAKEAKKEKRAAALAARPEAAPEASTSKAGAASAAGVGPAGRSGAAKSEQAGTSRKADGAASAKTAAAAPAPSHLPQDLLFSHLPSAHDPDTYLLRSGGKFKPHTIVARLGQLIASGEVKGTNARTIGLLSAFKMVIRDFGCPPEQMHRLLPAHISPMIAYLDHCRPKGVGGGNAIRYGDATLSHQAGCDTHAGCCNRWLKSEINKVGTDERITTESEVCRAWQISGASYPSTEPHCVHHRSNATTSAMPLTSSWRKRLSSPTRSSVARRGISCGRGTSLSRMEGECRPPVM